MEMPLYQGGIVNSRVREAHGMLDKARGELEDAERDVMAQVMQSYNGSVNAIEQVQALEQARISSLEAARATRIGLEIGTRNLVDLLNAEQQVYDIAREYTKARQEYVMNRLRLLAIAGRLTETDLQALNDYLAPPTMNAPIPPPQPKPLPAELEDAVIPDDGGLSPTPIIP